MLDILLWHHRASLVTALVSGRSMQIPCRLVAKGISYMRARKLRSNVLVHPETCQASRPDLSLWLRTSFANPRPHARQHSVLLTGSSCCRCAANYSYPGCPTVDFEVKPNKTLMKLAP